jgi:hypothetical protein
MKCLGFEESLDDDQEQLLTNKSIHTYLIEATSVITDLGSIRDDLSVETFPICGVYRLK